jgi:hypothetical protein
MHLYCMRQILVFNATNTVVTDIECNIRIDRLPLARAISFPLVRTTTQGQSVYPNIALYICDYCVYCIEDQNMTHTI